METSTPITQNPLMQRQRTSDKMITSLRFFIVIVLALVSVKIGATTIVIVNGDGAGEGFNSNQPVSAVPGNSATTLGQQYLNVFLAAADFWESKIDSSVPIRMDASIDPLICTATGAQLGGAGPNNGFFNFSGAPKTSTIYPSALANSLAGQDLDPTDNDLTAVFNSLLNGNPSCLGGIRWWLGIDSPAPSGTISLFDTVLHEIGHGIGFLTFTSANGTRPLNLTDAYADNLFDLSRNRAWPALSNAQRAASSTNTGNLVWRGANVEARAGVITGGRRQGSLRMFAPSPFQQGSSVSHWDTALSPDELMEPFATPTSNSCATILALKDMGWKTRNECGRPVVAPILPLLLDD